MYNNIQKKLWQQYQKKRIMFEFKKAENSEKIITFNYY